MTIHSTFGLYPRPMDGTGDVRSVRRLECVECGRVSRENERGWQAYLTDDEDEPAEVVVYCPECDKREFGGFLAGFRRTSARSSQAERAEDPPTLTIGSPGEVAPSNSEHSKITNVTGMSTCQCSIPSRDPRS